MRPIAGQLDEIRMQALQDPTFAKDFFRIKAAVERDVATGMVM
jgi:hypothetical protein